MLLLKTRNNKSYGDKSEEQDGNTSVDSIHTERMGAVNACGAIHVFFGKAEWRRSNPRQTDEIINKHVARIKISLLDEFKTSAPGTLQLWQWDASVLSERLTIDQLFSMTGSAAHMLKADDASFIVCAFPGAVIHAVKTCWMKSE